MDLFGKNELLGIDVGSTSIKIVEVSRIGKKSTLKNYISFSLPPSEQSLKIFEDKNLVLISNQAAQIIQALLRKARIKTKKAVFSLPDFSTFFATFSLPPMHEAEIAQAVDFEIRHYIPLPLNEVTFDWQIIAREETAAGVKVKILLAAVPNTVIYNYQQLAQMTQLEVQGMEAEVFGFIRSCWPSSEKYRFLPLCLIDLGWESTTVSIAQNKQLLNSFSFDFGGRTLINDLSASLKISAQEAEQLKNRYGLDPQKPEVARPLLDKINLLALEVEKICEDFYRQTNKRIDNIFLAGGSASLFGLKEYLSSRIKKNVFWADPFAALSFPLLLSQRLKQLGPSFAIAVGAALLENR